MKRPQAPSLILFLGFLMLTATVSAQTELCEQAAVLDPAGEVESSPRENRDAELLALGGSRGVAADDGLYRTIVSDLEDLSLSHPEITAIPARLEPLEDGLFLIFIDATARDTAENGDNPDFNCLTELYDLEEATWYSSLPEIVFLQFDGAYRIDVLAEFFRLVPDVQLVDFNGSLFVDDAGCAYRDTQGRRIYFFEEWGDFPFNLPLRLVRAELDAGEVLIVEEAHPYSPELDEEYTACKAGLLGNPTTVEIPTASSPALFVLALLLAVAGFRTSILRRRATG